MAERTRGEQNHSRPWGTLTVRTITLALSLVLIFTIPWEGVVDVRGLGTVASVMGLAVAAVWLATVVLTGRFRRPRLFHMVVLLFVLWNVVSAFWSADVDRTLAHAWTWAAPVADKLASHIIIRKLVL